MGPTRDRCNPMERVAKLDMGMGTETKTLMILKCNTTLSKVTLAIDPIKEDSKTTTEVILTFNKLVISIACITFLICIQKILTICTESQKME